MMLGHNVPKPLVKGEYAKRIREAVRLSTATLEEMETVGKQPSKYEFEWNEY